MGPRTTWRGSLATQICTSSDAHPQVDLGPLDAVLVDCRRLGAGILASREILDLIDLPTVPENSRLVKGVLRKPGRSVPLVDCRVDIATPSLTGKNISWAVVAEIGGMEVGIIIGPPADA